MLHEAGLCENGFEECQQHEKPTGGHRHQTLLAARNPLREHVHIRQKTVKHTPAEKLTDAFIAILAGAHGLCEVTRLVGRNLGV